MTAMEPWREPTPAEHELLRVLALADFAQAPTVRAQLEGVLVASNCGCGCGSLELQIREDAPLLAPGGGGDIVSAEGRDAAGRPSQAALLTSDGLRLRLLEIISPLPEGCGPPLPATLVQLDPVRRGAETVWWLVPRKRTILEEAAERA